MSRPPAQPGIPFSEIDTPALLIDLDAFERNLRRMADAAAKAGVRLRPHAKTHKSPTIARLQMEHGAVGVCCQKVSEAEILANTRKGKQVLSVDAPEEMRLCVAARGDMVATLGENRKLLLFPLDQVPEMTRGKGVRLQKYKDGGIADMRVFRREDGLTWMDSSGRSFVRSMADLKDWLGDRAQAGRLPPKGFPKSNSFGPKF